MLGIPSTVIRFAVVVVVATTLTGTSFGQVTIFNSNGFDSAGYSNGNLNTQQGFTSFPNNSAFTVQSGTVLTPSRAVQITGLSLSSNVDYAHGNFAYQTHTQGTFSPVASGNPYVVASFSINTPTVHNPLDIPFAGLHFEGFTSGSGVQQSVSPIMVGLNGEIAVFTDEGTGGTRKAVFTNTGVVPRGAGVWTKITAEFNFSGPQQSFRVFVDNSPTPVQFTRDGSGAAITPITTVPFRNTFGQTVSIAESGIIAFGTTDPFGNPPGAFQSPINNVFIDDLNIVMQTTPVPEPGTILAVAAIGAFGLRTWRRRRGA